MGVIDARARVEHLASVQLVVAYHRVLRRAMRCHPYSTYARLLSGRARRCWTV
jgi:hypothetical protein